MAKTPKSAKGWRPIPLALKILSVVLVLWSAGSVVNLPNLMANGAPFFGAVAHGPAALLMVLVFDIAGPLGFLYGLWARRPWAPKWALAYMGVFILNGVVAFSTAADAYGAPQILVPTLASAVFLAVIQWQRGYFAGH